MEQYHRSHGKKVSAGTGGRRRKSRDKKLAHMGGVFASTKVSDTVTKVTVRKRGGSTRKRIKKGISVNVVLKDGKMKTATIKKLLESHNPEYVRMNIITRGAVLDTDLGKVKVTNRVGQDGIVNGVLL
jgi:small subunit ribosomal protein S8e